MTDAALTDMVVLEIGDRRATAACGLLLAQAGATVIVVEPEAAPLRDKWASRATLLAGKRSLLWDGDSDLLRQAVAAADIVLLSSDLVSPVGSAVSDMLGGDQIVCDITAFGRDASADMTGWPEKLMQAVSGVADITGPSDAPPTLSDVAVLEFHAGIYAASGVLAALRVRRRDGVAQRVDVSIYECGVNSLATFLPLHYGGKETTRAGNRHPMAAPWNAFQAADGWLLMCSAKDQHWVRLCDIMGVPELGREGNLTRLADRIVRVDEVDAIVNAWTMRRSVEACIAELSAGEIASGPIVTVAQFETDSNIAHRGMVRRVSDPATGRSVLVAGTPLRASLTPGVAPRHAPRPGSDRELASGLRHRALGGSASCPDLPCSGLRVIEIGQYTTAPLAARQLASFGAEVIKLEPLEGEASRAWPPHQDGTGYFFAMSNAGKRSLSLDLRNDADRKVFRKLLRVSDVLVENMKPGSLTRLGFPPDVLQQINPALIYCGISGFGADSTLPGRPAFDTVVQAMSGLMDLTSVDGVPMKLGISAGDITGGIMALFAILAMLEVRDRTGKGQSIDLAMQDAAVWITQTNWNGETSEPACVLACADGYVAVMAEHAAATGALSDSGIDAARSNRAEMVASLRRHGFAAAPVRTIAEIADDPATVETGLIDWCRDGRLDWPRLRAPVRLSRTPCVVGRPVGVLGEARDDVLALVDPSPLPR